MLSRALGLLEMVQRTKRQGGRLVLRQRARRDRRRGVLDVSQKIDLDHGRFRQIIRGKIKQNLRKYISQGEMIAQQGQGHGLDPAAAGRHPALQARRQAAGRRRAGRRRGRRRRSARARSSRAPGEAGDRPGEHLLEVEVSLDELAEILGEELELPRIQPKGTEKIVAWKDKYTGIRTTGPESLRHFRRTFKQALRRQIAMGTYDPKNPIIVPIRDDKRYRSLAQRAAAAVATPSSST